METIKVEFKDIYNRAFNSIRNRIGITAADLGRNLRVRVIGNGTPVTRTSGLQVLLFNTNVMNSSMLAEVVARLKPEAFNAAATDLEAATLYLRETQNMGSVPFTVPVTNRQAQLVGQGATVDVTVADIVLSAPGHEGEHALGLNFNRVIPAEIGTSVSSAFEALLAGTGTAPAGAAQADPFAGTTVAAAKPAKAQA